MKWIMRQLLLRLVVAIDIVALHLVSGCGCADQKSFGKKLYGSQREEELDDEETDDDSAAI